MDVNNTFIVEKEDKEHFDLCCYLPLMCLNIKESIARNSAVGDKPVTWKRFVAMTAF